MITAALVLVALQALVLVWALLDEPAVDAAVTEACKVAGLRLAALVAAVALCVPARRPTLARRHAVRRMPRHAAWLV